MSKPKSWPDSLHYLRSPLHDPSLSQPQLNFLRTKPSESSSSSSSLPIIATSSTPIPNPNVKIQLITEPSHPAYNQHGLFAARNLEPGTFILAYLGRVHSSAGTDPGSDYDLWLDREMDVAVDASAAASGSATSTGKMVGGGGNEARFVNDYRGVKDRPNAEFGSAWCERWGEVCVGFWVMGGGKGKTKGKGKGIRKGEEILVSYGKGFWDKRREEEEETSVDPEAGDEG